jgi:APA family basic amino acid/polyamine antiporter
LPYRGYFIRTIECSSKYEALPAQLKRVIKTPGAILMGLGSILGTGLFVSLAIATNIAGDGIFVAIVLAAMVATLNGLSSAQLAAAHPVSGGTYEYGYRFLGSYWGFSAGWMFLVAKSASAATAVMGSVAYFFYLIGVEVSGFISTSAALGVLIIITVLVAGGISRSNRANMLIVGTTLAGLAVLVIAGLLTQSAPAENINFSITDLDPNSTTMRSSAA